MRKQTKLVAVLSAAALLAIGASMTSFAATKGWVQEGEDWVYLNSDGERETSVWRRSGENYYYLDEDGIMATDTIIEDANADGVYYVDVNGVKLMNTWKSVPNDDNIKIGDQTRENVPDVLWYYFGSSGKAYTAPVGEVKKIREIGGKYYMFDEEGHMLSGWQETTNSKGGMDLYYLGNENEGWARTEWQFLEPDEDLTNGEYDEMKWFWFGTNGKAHRDKSSYINGRYYHFNGFGVMDDDWYFNDASKPTAASGAMAFANVNGALSNGWVYTGDADIDADVRYDNDDLYWYYLVTVRGENKVARSIPYNYVVYEDDGKHNPNGPVRAKVIKNKTYIFNNDGKMLKGFVLINDGLNEDPTDADNNKTTHNWVTAEMPSMAHLEKEVTNFAGSKDEFNGIQGRTLLNGLYYFNEAGGSVQGQMMTGRTAITKDGDTFYYFFSKDKQYPGYAYTNAIQDGYLYGPDGKCIVAEDGNNYAVYTLENDVVNMSKKTSRKLNAGEAVVVSRTGKVRIGSVTIDGVRYTTDKDGAVVKTDYPD